jgi:hypothetical protein
MADSQVDLEPRRSDLLVDLVTESTDKLGYSLLERRVGIFAGRMAGDRPWLGAK